MESWQTYLNENQEHFIDDLLAFLRIPSISALPEHADDVQRAADWVAERLRAAGIEQVEALATAGALSS